MATANFVENRDGGESETDRLPKAIVKQHLAQRLRLCIAARKKDAAYFAALKDRLEASLGYQKITVSSLTGSVILEDSALDLEAVRRIAREHQLFSINSAPGVSEPFAKRVVEPIYCANRGVNEMTDGVMDLPGVIFLLLIGFGLWELAIGNFRRPPWYTAFWYAFGLFSKNLYDDLYSADS